MSSSQPEPSTNRALSIAHYRGLTATDTETPVEENSYGGVYEVTFTEDLERAHRGPSRILWVAIATLATAITWAAFAEIDQITRGTGSIIASQKTQVIQAADGGVIEELLVKEGDTVTANQVLATLDQSKVGAAVAEVQSKLYSLSATVIRLKAEVLERPLNFPTDIKFPVDVIETQKQLFQKRRQALYEEIGSLARSLKISQEELQLNEELMKTGDVSKTELLRLQRQTNDLQAQITNRKNKYFQDSQAELAKAEEDLAAITQTLNQRQTSLDYATITAPAGGVVRNVRFTTKGAVLRPGDELLTIVPTADNLIIEAKIKPSDIAFVRRGMHANVKIDAYDYSVFGTLDGLVTYISADTLTEDAPKSSTGEPQTYYRVHIETTSKQFKKRPDQSLELLPGMTGTVEIKTGNNTVLKYLVKPLVKTLNEAMTER